MTDHSPPTTATFSRIPPTRRERVICGLVMSGIAFPALVFLSLLFFYLGDSTFLSGLYVFHFIIIPILLAVVFPIAHWILPVFFFRQNWRIIVSFIGGGFITVAAAFAAAFLNGLILIAFLEIAGAEAINWVGKWEADGLAFWHVAITFWISVFFSPVIAVVAIFLNRYLIRKREENPIPDSSVFE
ncbi:hypothetical protein [Kiloniella laminariae]|uniref:hypothetical protein n=1 Tax=Kiloniella laminariae TaxID=454162 RepID=UPI000377ED18|nr:hypothetical protein [Kiloniella laminariae]